MGEVYRAHDERLNRDVAVKVLPEALTHDPERLQRFEREARAAAGLNHPNILDVHDVGEHEGRAFIVTELLEGESLRTVIASGRLTLQRALELGHQVATGLAAAHDRGITHRDLKPANLFLTREGQIKILDFGLAKLARPGAPPAELSESPTRSLETRAGVTMGTPGYMAPEQLRGKPADPRSDVFSFGVVLYEMITGRHPFPGATTAEIQAAILKEAVPSLALAAPETPPLLEHLVRRCLEKQPEDRFQSARELVFALEELSSGNLETARGGARSTVLRRAGLAVVAAAAVVTAVLVLQQPSHGVPFQERNWLLITSVENLTGEPTFDHALDPALTVAIEQSSYVNVLSRDSIQPVLRQMKRADETVIDETLGREIARRRGIDVILAPSISKLGNRYALTASIKDAVTGSTYASRIVQADGIDEVLPALDRLCREIRGALGESLASVAQHSKPLAEATTSSLAALEQYSFAVEHHTRGDPRGAREHYEAALRIDPHFTAAKVGLGILHLDWGQFLPEADPAAGKALLDDALAEVDGLTDRERLSVVAQHAWFVERDPERAIELFRALLSVYPDQPAAHQNLARIYLQTGRSEDAVAEYEAAIRIDPNFIIAYNGLVYLLNTLGEVDATIQWANREIEVDPTQPWPYANLCLTYLAKDDVERALAAGRRAVELQPTSADCQFMLGHALKYAGRFPEAAAAYEKVLELTPSNPWGHYHAGVALQYAGHAARAREHFVAFRDAIENNIAAGPDLISDHMLIDMVNIRLGEKPLTVYTEEQLGSTDPDFNLALAQIASLQGRTDEALFRLQTALDAGVSDRTWVMIEPDFDAIRNDPRFEGIKRRTLKLGDG
jgi:serine/threonine protein kinase/Tfp pilus assembly protein PilF